MALYWTEMTQLLPSPIHEQRLSYTFNPGILKPEIFGLLPQAKEEISCLVILQSCTACVPSIVKVHTNNNVSYTRIVHTQHALLPTVWLKPALISKNRHFLVAMTRITQSQTLCSSLEASTWVQCCVRFFVLCWCRPQINKPKNKPYRQIRSRRVHIRNLCCFWREKWQAQRYAQNVRF